MFTGHHYGWAVRLMCEHYQGLSTPVMVAVFFSAALDWGAGKTKFALWRLGLIISVGNGAGGGKGGRGMNRRTLFHIV